MAWSYKFTPFVMLKDYVLNPGVLYEQQSKSLLLYSLTDGLWPAISAWSGTSENVVFGGEQVIFDGEKVVA